MGGYVSRVVQTRLDCPLPTQDEDFPLRVEEPGWSSLVSPPALFKVPTKLFFVQLCSTFLKLCSTFPPLFYAWNTWKTLGGITPCRDNWSDTPLCAMIPPSVTDRVTVQCLEKSQCTRSSTAILLHFHFILLLRKLSHSRIEAQLQLVHHFFFLFSCLALELSVETFLRNPIQDIRQSSKMR